jgi:formate hydrogenlyase subunit 3/multisubunit Na+/H+ antiporter MnhD subunit
VWIAAAFVLLSFFGMYWSFIVPMDDSDTDKSSKKAAERKLFGSAWTRGQKTTIALVLIAIVLILLVWLPWYTGELQAKAQTRFWVPSTYPQSVVLRICGDRLICGGLDETGLDGSFFVIRLDDEPKPVLTLNEIGHL